MLILLNCNLVSAQLCGNDKVSSLRLTLYHIDKLFNHLSFTALQIYLVVNSMVLEDMKTTLTDGSVDCMIYHTMFDNIMYTRSKFIDICVWLFNEKRLEIHSYDLRCLYASF